MNQYKNTYCNPLKVENYPMGYEKPDHRSLADPSVIYYDGKWYLYPSYGMAYVSEDFVTWEHHPIEPADIGYAPTVVVHKGRFYLCANRNCSLLYVADDPLGPFEPLGDIRYENGEKFKGADMMLFSDDDERLYCYWTDNLTGKESDIAIFGIELDADCPTRAIGTPKLLIPFVSEHTWERFGARSQHTGLGWIEGAWMVKINGRYYLTYSGSGTSFGTYAAGAYYSDEGPLEGFVYQRTNPICSRNYGVTRGGGHGCIVEGPGGTYWSFYTIPISYRYYFERRIGMDPIMVDENGEIKTLENTDTPQWAPGVTKDPYHEGTTDLLPLTINMPAAASSCAAGRDALYAVDENLQSWWQPDAGDTERSLTINLRSDYLVSAARIIWRDVGIDIENGALPGAFQYRIAVSEDGDSWVTVVDKNDNTTDFAVDYQTFETAPARFVRLIVTGAPAGIEPGVIDFTAFGKHV